MDSPPHLSVSSRAKKIFPSKFSRRAIDFKKKPWPHRLIYSRYFREPASSTSWENYSGVLKSPAVPNYGILICEIAFIFLHLLSLWSSDTHPVLSVHSPTFQSPSSIRISSYENFQVLLRFSGNLLSPPNTQPSFQKFKEATTRKVAP